MANLEGLAEKIMARLESEGRLITLSFEETSKIETAVALKLKEIKNDFELKEKRSKAFISRLELTSFSTF